MSWDNCAPAVRCPEQRLLSLIRLCCEWKPVLQGSRRELDRIKGLSCSCAALISKHNFNSASF